MSSFRPTPPPVDLDALRRRTVGWRGDAFCHVPADGTPDLAAIAGARDGGGRWAVSGSRTTYLATDPGVALAELARQLGPADTTARRLLRLRVRTDGLLDLRDPDVLTALAVRGAPVAFLHRPLTRRISGALREAGVCTGLIVPSMAFLDAPERRVLVLFDDRLPGGLPSAVTGVAVVGRVGVLG